MSTYLEIVIQERGTDGRSILTHRHFKIHHATPGELALYLANKFAVSCQDLAIKFDASDPLRPCSLCWQIGQEATHDPL